jgi:HlyD family secretion protein
MPSVPPPAETPSIPSFKALGSSKLLQRWRLWAVLGAACLVALGAFAWCAGRPQAADFVTAPVAKGDVARSIVTSGSVNPVVTVQVGSYVSGPIQAIFCDFNTEVKSGQLCAKIDPRTYQQAVDQAKASLATAEAQLRKDRASLAYAKINYERDRGLKDTGVVSEDALDADKSALDQAAAQVQFDEATIAQRKAALEAAQVNLDYTDIVSPVNGTVVSRNVDVGQTVAASFQTPTLFLIAQDLAKMQVDTNVSESDVGAARAGQRASFTVEAYPDRTFAGQVVQVRRTPITVQNVVTYDVVIGCENPDLLLFPGMTADARIIVEEQRGVLTVPEEALRFDPRGAGGAQENPHGLAPDTRRVWVLRDGRPVAVPVTVGLTDGTRTEISGAGLTAGDLVILDVAGPRSGRSGPRARSPFGF